MGITLRTLVPKLETTDVENSLKRYDSKNICTGQVLKQLGEGNNVRIRDALQNNWIKKATVIGQHKSAQSYIVKIEDGNWIEYYLWLNLSSRRY